MRKFIACRINGQETNGLSDKRIDTGVDIDGISIKAIKGEVLAVEIITTIHPFEGNTVVNTRPNSSERRCSIENAVNRESRIAGVEREIGSYWASAIKKIDFEDRISRIEKVNVDFVGARGTADHAGNIQHTEVADLEFLDGY